MWINIMLLKLNIQDQMKNISRGNNVNHYRLDDTEELSIYFKKIML